MEISTEISSFKKIGNIKKILELLKMSGFTAYDFSMFNGGLADEILYADKYKDLATDLRKYADEIGIRCNQSHAPFPTMDKGDDKFYEVTFPKLIRSIEVSRILGAKICVVHPGHYRTAEENAQMYKQLEPYARNAGIKIGLENLWKWPIKENRAGQKVISHLQDDLHYAQKSACSDHFDFKKHLDLLPADIFVACLDIGHAQMKGMDTSVALMTETIGSRIECIHLHDTDCWHDNHQIPFTYNIDFSDVITALKKIGYKGDITLEADRFAARVPIELMPAAAKYMCAIAQYFKEQIEY